MLTVVLALILGVAGTVAMVALPAHAAPAATTLVLSGTGGTAGATTTLALELRTTDGRPVAGATVLVERASGGGGWAPVGTVGTDAAGRATLPATIDRVPARNAFRASWAGDTTYAGAAAATQVRLTRLGSSLAVTGPGSVTDGASVDLQVTWRTVDGQPVAGPVRLQRRNAGGKWRTVTTLRTGPDGTARLRVRPRVDTAWRARAAALAWVEAARSGIRSLDNRPPGDRVRLPKRAPRPRVRLPRQRRAVDEGANLAVTRIPAGVWRQMTGRSWRRGCPVGRAGLRLVRVNYWGYDGYRYRGELVANARAARAMGGALAEMYAAGHAVRSMYRVDRFGWSKRLRGADDYRSMAAGNTSAFNCRHVVGRPGVRSPHSYGTALDVNTWENPYRSARGIVPNRFWQARSHPNVAWRSRNHAVVRIMARHGLRWTYGLGDTQHFDYVGPAGTAGAGRSVAHLHPQCTGFICE
ncbi:M15 family metallopeptidase [Nocardioides pantholopis]|uniref:M15 family metallopeptidase n=1 Tax=Nocardioides pantholopis TaxID=2483798 RepID=UPI000F084E27|nr:M15 family metallopeptidase [Nocardioides pantholopis]